MCSPKEFPIPPHFYPILFANVGPRGEELCISKTNIQFSGASTVSNFFSDGPIKLVHCKKQNWTWETPHLMNRRGVSTPVYEPKFCPCHWLRPKTVTNNFGNHTANDKVQHALRIPTPPPPGFFGFWGGGSVFVVFSPRWWLMNEWESLGKEGRVFFLFFWEIIPFISLVCVPYTWGNCFSQGFCKRKEKKKLKNHEVSTSVLIFL